MRLHHRTGTSHHRLPFALALLVAGVVLGACGGDDDYRQSLINELASDSETTEFSDETLQCQAEVVVDEIGVDTLQEAGYTADNILDRFNEDDYLRYIELDELVTLGLSCFTSDELGFVLSPSFDDVVIEIYQCAVEELGDERARELIAQQLDSSDQTTARDLDEAIASCT